MRREKCFSEGIESSGPITTQKKSRNRSLGWTAWLTRKSDSGSVLTVKGTWPRTGNTGKKTIEGDLPLATAELNNDRRFKGLLGLVGLGGTIKVSSKMMDRTIDGGILSFYEKKKT